MLNLTRYAAFDGHKQHVRNALDDAYAAASEVKPPVHHTSMLGGADGAAVVLDENARNIIRMHFNCAFSEEVTSERPDDRDDPVRDGATGRAVFRLSAAFDCQGGDFYYAAIMAASVGNEQAAAWVRKFAHGGA